jgi:hypothetical protein
MLTHSIYSKISLLPHNRMGELMDFIEFLLSKEVSKVEKNKTKRKPQFGCAKGKFKMSADFDAPLEDFNEYMP